LIEPSLNAAQAWLKPGATSTALLMPRTAAGLEDRAVFPLPTCLE